MDLELVQAASLHNQILPQEVMAAGIRAAAKRKLDS